MYGWGGVAPVAAQGYAAAAQALQDEEVLSITLSTNRGMAPSMAEFFNNELLSDINIRSQDGESFKCHKLVLIRWSAPLRRMLTGDMREAHEASITLHGVDTDVLAAFLSFMYTCSCTVATEKLVALTALADQYDVTLLQQLCMDAIRTHAPNHRCCCLFYKAAKEVQQSDIQQLAWEHLASNLSSLVRQHSVFVQLQLEDVLLLCGRPLTAAAAAVPSRSQCTSQGDAGSSKHRSTGQAGTAGAADDQQLPDAPMEGPRLHRLLHESAPSNFGGCGPSAARPEYLLFLALMTWLDHKPGRQQYRQSLLDCVDFDRMTNFELSQVRHHPQVESSNQLKDMLLDAYARRCLQSSQQPVYHMHPLSAAVRQQRQQSPGTSVGQQQQEHCWQLRIAHNQRHQHAPVAEAAAEVTDVGVQLNGELYVQQPQDPGAVDDGGLDAQMPGRGARGGRQWQG